MAKGGEQEPQYFRILPFGARTGPYEVFVSYSHVDEALRDELEAHLSPLSRSGQVSLWHDRRIIPGGDWATEIDEHIESAHVILLLVSPSFIASEYCYGVEMRRAMERHNHKDAIVIPVIVRPCLWDELPFAKLQALPRDGLAITSWTNRDEGYVTVAKGVRRAIQGLMPRDVVSGEERFSPSSLVALRTNFILRRGRTQPGRIHLVTPDVAFINESFMVCGAWELASELEGTPTIANLAVSAGVIVSLDRSSEGSLATIRLTANRGTFSALVRSNPDVNEIVVTLQAPAGLIPVFQSRAIPLVPFPHGDFP